MSVDDMGWQHQNKAIMLFKTPQSSVPDVLLIDLATNTGASTAKVVSSPGAILGAASKPAPKIKLMKRDPKSKGVPSKGQGGADGAGKKDKRNQNKSVTERERDYAAARARIFGER